MEQVAGVREGGCLLLHGLQPLWVAMPCTRTRRPHWGGASGVIPVADYVSRGCSMHACWRDMQSDVHEGIMWD